MDSEHRPRGFSLLSPNDRDLTMFTITNLDLIRKENDNMVYMSLKLKRKIVMEILTTFLPTILLLLITFTTTFFNKDLFGDALGVNLTIMLVMTTIFTSKIEELPPTSDTKMIDLWLGVGDVCFFMQFSNKKILNFNDVSFLIMFKINTKHRSSDAY